MSVKPLLLWSRCTVSVVPVRAARRLAAVVVAASTVTVTSLSEMAWALLSVWLSLSIAFSGLLS